MKSKYKWIFFVAIGSVDAICVAQEKTVTGVVSDAEGQPGVNVVVKGPNQFKLILEVCNQAKVGEVYCFLHWFEDQSSCWCFNVVM
jgi:hypothetical protein